MEGGEKGGKVWDVLVCHSLRLGRHAPSSGLCLDDLLPKELPVHNAIGSIQCSSSGGAMPWA